MKPLVCCAALIAMPILAAQHPTVYLKPADIQRARTNIEKYTWARQTSDAIRREADRWLQRSDDWLRGAVPPPGAAYAYGLSGCPICGAGFGPFGRNGGSFDRPRTIKCARGHLLPDAQHPDSGAGYKAPDGRMHYLVGAYNAFAIEALTFDALENLAYAYTLTGDERYAAKASVIFDAIAAVYPQSHKGCWDYPSNPPSGRLDRPWYQASRVLVHYVDHYDQLFNSKSLDEPSVVKGLSRRQNIERNLLRDAGEYCFTQSKAGRLHNGEADYIRGALAVGAVLDIPEYVEWALNGPFGIKVLLENDIDRDGGYFETTPMYADHTRELYFTFAEPLLNYKGVNLYAFPKLQAFLEPYNLPFTGAGILPRYGDAPPTFTKHAIPRRPFDRSDYDFLEKLYYRGVQAAAPLYSWIANGAWDKLRAVGETIPDRRVQAGMSIYREPGAQEGGSFSDRTWLLFHGGAPPAQTGSISPDWQRRLTKSDFYGQKGFAMLRNGAQALLLRFGPSLNHGHLDDLGINYIARGYELTYDIGYGHTAATQTQYGWAKQTASHNLVMVDERPQQEGGLTGGSLHLFADTPLVKVIEASSEGSYSKQNVRTYRRLCALIGSGDDTYLLDIFRVAGGSQHDYIFRALGDNVTFDGVKLGAPEAGHSWSDEQLPDGDMRGHPGQPSWNPPPGNGLGFLGKWQRGRTTTSWSADWQIDPTTHVRLHVPADESAEILTAVANGLYPQYPKTRAVFIRRRGANLSSHYVTAIEPHGGTPKLRSIENLPDGARITHIDGTIDEVHTSPFTFTRGKSRTTVATLAGRIDTLDTATHSFNTSTPLPPSMINSVIIFSNPAYTRTTAYRIAAINGNRVTLHATVKLGIGQVTEVKSPTVLTTLIPHEYAFSDKSTGEHSFFTGKQIRAASGATTTLKAVKAGQPMTLTVADTSKFHPGDKFEYLDIQPGDRFEILTVTTR